MPIKKSISVIIPNYNGACFLKENIPSVYEALETSGIEDFEIIVADDASTDDSVVFLQEQYPDIIIIINPINKGFSGNTNTGIQKATKDLVFILNSDVQLSPNYFSPLMPYFENEDTFGVMGKIVSIDGKIIYDSVKYPRFRFAYMGDSFNAINETQNGLLTTYLSGANALMDREKILELGGFNELYDPYYFEDVDLGITAWRKGYKLYYESNAVCYHLRSATIKKQKLSDIKRIFKRNKIIINYLHLSAFQWSCFVLHWALKSMVHALLFDPLYIQAFGDFLSIRRKYPSFKQTYSVHHKLSLSDIQTFISKKNRPKKLRVLMYHDISKNHSDYIVVSKNKLEKQIKYILAKGYTPIFVRDLPTVQISKHIDNPIIMQFDDGYQSNADILFPLIENYQLKISIALVINYIGKTSGWDGKNAQSLMDLKTLQNAPKNLVEYVYHSYSHINYRDANIKDVLEDIDSCITNAQNLDLLFTPAFVYPYGCLPDNPETKQQIFEALQAKGIKWAFIINANNGIEPLPIKENYQINRIHIDGRDSMLRFKLKLRFGGFEK